MDKIYQRALGIGLLDGLIVTADKIVTPGSLRSLPGKLRRVRRPPPTPAAPVSDVDNVAELSGYQPLAALPLPAYCDDQRPAELDGGPGS